MHDEEQQGLLKQNNLPTAQHYSESNWEVYDRKPNPKEPEPNKMDAIVIIILLALIAIAGFGVYKHYEIDLVKKPINLIANTTTNLTNFTIDNITLDFSEEEQMEILNVPNQQPPEDEAVIEEVLNSYIKKIEQYSDIEQYNDIRIDWEDSDDVDDVELKEQEKVQEELIIDKKQTISNQGILSVCDDPIYSVSGLGSQKISDFTNTINIIKYDGNRDLKRLSVNISVEFPMPDFSDDCRTKEQNAKDSLQPFQLASNVWWKPSNQGNMVYTGLFIEKPESSLIQGKTMLKLLQKYYQELAMKQLINEFQSGYEVLFKETINGLDVQMLSNPERQIEFFDKVFDLLNVIDQSVFNQVKDKLIKDVKRFYQQKLPFLAEQFYLRQIMLRSVNTPEEMLQELEKTSFDLFIQFKDNLLTSKIQILNLGNTLPQESVYSDSSEMYFTRTLKLNDTLIYSVPRVEGSENMSAVVNYYQTGVYTIENFAKLEFYAEFLSEKANTQFPASWQVQVKRRPLGCTDGLLFYVQGQAPDSINSDVDLFIDTCNIQYMGDIEKEKYRERTIKRLKDSINFRTLQDEGRYVWDKIINSNFGFNDIILVIEYLEKCDLDEIIPEFQGSISVQIFGGEDVKVGNFTEEQAIGQEVYECFYQL